MVKRTKKKSMQTKPLKKTKKKTKKTKKTKKSEHDKYELSNYLKIGTMQKNKYLKMFDKLSPFEFKNTLMKRAALGPGKVLNVGRGNPNFFNSFCREVFADYQKLALKACERSIIDDLKDFPKEDDHNYEKFIIKHSKSWPTRQREYIENYIDYLKKRSHLVGLSHNAILHDSVQSTLGCFYPTPPRCHHHVRLIVQEYMYNLVMKPSADEKKRKEKFEGLRMKPTDFDFFLTEGAAAGIMYVLNTLSKNYLVNPHEKIALITPIFSPYMEMPYLQEYNEQIVRLKGNPDKDFSLDDDEINKLKDRGIKALFMVNPSNPGSYSLSKDNIEKIGAIVNNERQDLIVLADNVYAPFAEEYNSFMLVCPRNTIEIFSLSKYFGTTGWRLGVVMTAKDNRINELLKNLPAKQQKLLVKRYETVTFEPAKMTLLDRIVSDAREVAQEHVSGLSTPQQVLLGMFLFYDLNDKDRIYDRAIKTILRDRITQLYEPLKTSPHIVPTSTNYYHLLFIPAITENLYGKGARDYLEKNYVANEFLLHLSLKYKTVLMPGKGFGAADWRLRISLANMATDNYRLVGDRIRDAIKDMVKPVLTGKYYRTHAGEDPTMLYVK
jgi:aspartate 4-decarboxylase